MLTRSNHGGVGLHEVQTDTSRELLPKNRLAVTRLTWTRRQDDVILAVCMNGFLVISIHQIQSIQTLQSAMAMCRHDNYSPVVGTPPVTGKAHSGLIASSSNDETNITMVSQLLPIRGFMLSSSNELSQLPASPDLDKFFQDKHDTYTSAGATNFFKIYGAASSSNSVVISFLFEYISSRIILILAFHQTTDLNTRCLLISNLG